ncbi:MAG TPA: hypothetical protein EYP49_17360 [Anaerolineae bacterium]|nr:hypothetical protein [Anaerolineae bacterium]
MSRAKVWVSVLTVLILIALSGASVWAAPNEEDPPEEESALISGVIEDIVIEADEDTGTTTVLVTLLVDETTGETRTVRLSLETALALGLVVEDADGNLTINEEMIEQTVEINPDDVIEDDGEGFLHPVASALAEFFADTLGLDYDEIMGYHEDGMGFGVIAQACWMSYMLGDEVTASDILEAKKSGDFSSIELPDGETATNWGQFKKAALSNDKAQKNLGAIMSGRAGMDQEQQQETAATANQGQGKGKKGKGTSGEGSGPPAGSPGKGKDKGNDSGPPAEPPGKGKDKGESGGKPDTPPGQDKGGGSSKGGSKGKGK